MRRYVYCWQLSVREGIDLEIRITAESAPAARRRVDSFLAERRPLLGREGREATARAPLRRMETSEIEAGGAKIGTVPVLAGQPRAIGTQRG